MCSIMNIKKFVNEEFGIVRALTIKEDPWFIGTDVATALGYKRPYDAISKRVAEEDRQLLIYKDGKLMLSSEDKSSDNFITASGSNEIIPSKGSGTNRLTIINETGLYSLIMRSKLKSAYEFQRWVTGVVLPNIRKYGAHVEPSHERIRAISKMIRAMEVSAISTFLKYCRKHGFKKDADKVVYAKLSSLANEYSDIETGMRDKTGSTNLLILITLEAKIMSTLYNSMVNQIDPEVILKFVYTNV